MICAAFPRTASSIRAPYRSWHRTWTTPTSIVASSPPMASSPASRSRVSCFASSRAKRAGQRLPQAAHPLRQPTELALDILRDGRMEVVAPEELHRALAEKPERAAARYPGKNERVRRL